jgi:hypothetical protein
MTMRLLDREGTDDPKLVRAEVDALLAEAREADAYVRLLDFMERHTTSQRKPLTPLFTALGTTLAEREAKIMRKTGNNYRFATQRIEKDDERRWDFKVRERVLTEPRPVAATHLANGKKPSRSWLKAIPRFECCTFVDLSSCAAIDADVIAAVAPTRRLRELSLFSTDADDACLEQAAQIPTLERINLGCCPRVTGSGFAHLATLPQLSVVELHTSRFDEANLAELVKLTSLRQLNLAFCHQLTRQGIETIAQMSALEELSLASCCHLGDEEISLLATMPSLQRLTIVNTKITDAGLAQLSAAFWLKDVDVRYTDVTPDAYADFLATTSARDR